MTMKCLSGLNLIKKHRGMEQQQQKNENKRKK